MFKLTVCCCSQPLSGKPLWALANVQFNVFFMLGRAVQAARGENLAMVLSWLQQSLLFQCLQTPIISLQSYLSRLLLLWYLFPGEDSTFLAATIDSGLSKQAQHNWKSIGVHPRLLLCRENSLLSLYLISLALSLLVITSIAFLRDSYLSLHCMDVACHPSSYPELDKTFTQVYF